MGFAVANCASTGQIAGLRIEALMTRETKDQRRRRQAHEVEESQRGLRDSIKKTQDLLDQSDEMLKRHRRECDEASED